MKAFFKHLALSSKIIAAAALIAVASPLFAQTLTPPIQITTSSASDGPTLGIPRWKGYMLETDPNQFWLAYASNSGTSGNIIYTTDGGQTWSSNVIQIDANGIMDMHLSVSGRNGDLFFTWPGLSSIGFREINAPAHAATDRGILTYIAGTTALHRSNIMVQNTGRIWLFTRLSYASVAENVLYHYSDDNGATWNNGTAYATNYNSVRIGSMPFVGGNPALVVEYLADGRGFEYYLWNGSTFEAKPDHSIYAANLQQERCFTHNQIRDSVFHLIFGVGTELHHVWKNFNNGSGSWNHQIIDTDPYNNDINLWFPTSTVRGDDLYLFYCKRLSSDVTSSLVYYKKWSQQSQTWTPPVLVSTGPANVSNRDPNGPFKVPDNSPYVPVVWRTGTGPFGIMFSKIVLSQDTIPPATIHDLGAAPTGVPGQVVLAWTATGNNGAIGRAYQYDIRYAQFSITASDWSSATPVADPPVPKPTGSVDSCVVTGLSPGATYYFAVRAADSAFNWSDLSNIVVYNSPADVADNHGRGSMPIRTQIDGNSPNPFSGSTEIRFSLSSTSHVGIEIFDLLGREVRRLMDKTLPPGAYSVQWDGRDAAGRRLAAGVYFSRLSTGEVVSSCRMVLVR